MSIAIETGTVLVETFLSWYFLNGMLGKSNHKTSTKVILLTAFFIAETTITLFLEATLLRFVLSVVFVFMIALLYWRRPVLRTFYLVLVLMLTSAVVDVVCGALLVSSGTAADAIMGGGAPRIIYIIISKLLHLMLLHVIRAVFGGGYDHAVLLRSVPLFVCQILSTIICTLNFESVIRDETGGRLSIIEPVGILLLNLIICIYVEALQQSYHKQQETEVSTQRLRVQEQYYAEVMRRQEETRSLWHDIKKYMAAMEALVRQENQEDAKECLAEVQAAFSHIENAVDTGNPLVDSVFTYAMNKASGAGVVLTPEIWVDSRLDFPASELFVIIGNTLDNAIDACLALPDEKDRVVAVSLYQKNHMLLYEIENTYIPTKASKRGAVHGYGLRNVRMCVERNGGEMSVTDQDGRFNVSIQLNLVS